MAPKLTDDEREDIIGMIEDGLPRNEVARRSGRSPGTVTTIAETAGLTFDRTATKTASEAKQADNRAKRAALIEALYEDADWMRRKLREAHKVYDFTKDGDFVTGNIDLPTAGDMRAYMTAVGIAIDKAVALERVDAGGVSPTATLLAEFVAALRE